MRRTKEDAEKTRENLLTVGVSVFNKNGYSNTRLEDIAEAANVTRGAIYHHFGGKAELFKEIALRNKHNMNLLIEQHISSFSDSPSKSLSSLISDIFKKLDNDPFFRDFEELRTKVNFNKELRSMKKVFESELKNGYGVLIEHIEKWEEQNKLKSKIDKEVLALSIISAINGLIDLYLRYGDALPIKENLDSITKLLFAHIKE